VFTRVNETLENLEDTPRDILLSFGHTFIPRTYNTYGPKVRQHKVRLEDFKHITSPPLFRKLNLKPDATLDHTNLQECR
jgi:hypothetical protein